MSYEVQGVVGDVNPLQYGGWLIGLRDTHVDCIVIEPIDWEENGKKQGEGIDCLTYRVCLDRFKVIGDINTRAEYLVPDRWDNSWSWGPDNTEWWDDTSFRESIQNSGIGWDEFVTAICSTNPVHRAFAWQEIASYFGIQNLDDYPMREKESDLRRRFALPFYRARQRGITVYA